MKKIKSLSLEIKFNLILPSKKQNHVILSEKLMKMSGNAMELLGKSKI
jgi:hypothetical protein